MDHFSERKVGELLQPKRVSILVLCNIGFLDTTKKINSNFFRKLKRKQVDFCWCPFAETTTDSFFAYVITLPCRSLYMTNNDKTKKTCREFFLTRAYK